jgi:adenylate cyclase
VATPLFLGRTAQWPTPWDEHVSRVHAEVVWSGEALKVTKIPSAKNEIFLGGAANQQFSILPGEHFVIGGTSFTLASERAFVTLEMPKPTRQQAYSSQYLRQMRFRHADQRIEILSRLPEVVSAATSDFDRRVRIVNLLLTAIPKADAAAILSLTSDNATIDVLHWDRRLLNGEDFEPSDRLIREAIQRKESVVHVWNTTDVADSAAFTARQGVDWAYCTPIPGKSTSGCAVYVSGRFSQSSSAGTSDPTDLRDDLKFTELAASTLGSLSDVRKLEHERASLSQFFSPVVLEAIGTEDPDVALRPRESEVTVLFCDLRGFARTSERNASDLMGLLNRVSLALGIATRQICEQSGVVGDFHGDSVMGFWGWPIEQADATLRAAKAALAIRAEFSAARNRLNDALTDFRVGIGIATGMAVAGKIGTVEQVKVTVFGPAVNLASRLEDMTKFVHAPVLIDERTAELLRQQMTLDVGRLRRIARVRPYGLEQPLVVSELLPSESDFTSLTSMHIREYEHALEDLNAGDWSAAFEHLHQVPSDDRVKDFLTMYIVQHNRKMPDGWNGVIPLSSK